MIFFALILGFTLAAAVAARLGLPGLGTWPARMRWGLAGSLIVAGVDHLVNPDRYEPMIGSFLPFAREIVLVTAACEIAGAVGLVWRRTQRVAAVTVAAYFVCVLPANVNNALNDIAIEGMPTADWYVWVRLLFQPVIILWTLYAGEILPRHRRGASPADTPGAGSPSPGEAPGRRSDR